ncbi:hypothetical protein EOE67_19255 [Rheinheimera riviphila]|uniref:Big-1 domain-containing protein n=1 Tax=Rheinheimera riviphila TaxID=1834037 RepID=A0A437QBV7_9GAMM|nr:hypothetical protein [Rheinheimera riviphila]RVU31997.1 hypothetical protein EOE67_19255 [Rheinheimera riviphila]
MKKAINKILLAAISTLLFPCPLLAGSGSAVVSHWSATDSTLRPTHIYISNINDNPVNVAVTFFDKNGNKVTAPVYVNFTNANTTLAANSTGYITIQSASLNYGYAVINWQDLPEYDNSVSLVAYALRIVSNTSSQNGNASIQINNGMPF